MGNYADTRVLHQTKRRKLFIKTDITLDNIVTTYRQIRDVKTVRRGRLRGQQPASFWRENVIAIVILNTGFSENVVETRCKDNVRSFISLQ